MVCTDDVFEIRFDADNETAAESLKMPNAETTLVQMLSAEAGRPLTVKVIRAHGAQASGKSEENYAEMFDGYNYEIVGGQE